AGKLRIDKVDLAAGELGAAEADPGAGELGVSEVDLAAGELGGGEVDLAAGEPSADEVAPVKDNAREVKVQALPRHRRIVLEVRGDDPDDGMADFAVGAEGK